MGRGSGCDGCAAGGPWPGQGLGHQAAAATDVENGEPFERGQVLLRPLEVIGDPVAQERHAGGTEPVKWCELAMRVPPLRRDAREALDFGGVEIGTVPGGCIGSGCHGGIGRVPARPVKPRKLPCPGLKEAGRGGGAEIHLVSL